MKHFLEILANIRIAAAEIGGTLSLLLLVWYGLRKAWHDFLTKDDVTSDPCMVACPARKLRGRNSGRPNTTARGPSSRHLRNAEAHTPAVLFSTSHPVTSNLVPQNNSRDHVRGRDNRQKPNVAVANPLFCRF
jgi:hypothetical protein